MVPEYSSQSRDEADQQTSYSRTWEMMLQSYVLDTMGYFMLKWTALAQMRIEILITDCQMTRKKEGVYEKEKYFKN